MIIFYNNEQSHIFNVSDAADTADTRKVELKMEYTKLTTEFQGSCFLVGSRIVYYTVIRKVLQR